MNFLGCKEEAVRMWQELDHDGSGQIDFEEFGGPEEAVKEAVQGDFAL